MEFIQIDDTCIMVLANTNSYIPYAYIISDISSRDPSVFLKKFDFKIIGSKLAVEKVVCNYTNSFVYCGFIHTGHLISWLQLTPNKNGDDLQNLTIVTSKTFENHADWTPVNLEVNDKFIAIEAISSNPEQGQTKYPRILMYNVTGSQYVWYSISLQDCAVTSIDVLSFVLVKIFDSKEQTNRTTLIVANRRDNANLLMYYETRPMVLSISSSLSRRALCIYSQNIGH